MRGLHVDSSRALQNHPVWVSAGSTMPVVDYVGDRVMLETFMDSFLHLQHRLPIGPHFFFLIIPMSLRKIQGGKCFVRPNPMCRWYKVSLSSHHKPFIFMFVPNSYCLVSHLGAALDSVRLSCPFYRCNKRLVSGRYYTNDAAP